jgi:predicted nucleic acid-binding protein
MILVDTSAWIDFFRGREPLAGAVDRALELDEAAICGPIVTELRRGLRSARDRRDVLALLSGCHSLEQPAALWEEAGDLGFALARKGATVKTVDLLIAAHAIAHGVALLAGDRDFERIRRAGVGLLLAELP